MHAPSTPFIPSSILDDALRAARAEAQRRDEAVAAGVTPDGSGDIVVARHITLEQLDDAPDELLKGLHVALRAGGELVITKLATGADHASAVAQVIIQTGAYATTNNTTVSGGCILFDGGDRLAQPDVQLDTTSRNPLGAGETIAVFEVEFTSRSCVDIITMANDYFEEIPSLHCVVVFKFFPPRRSALASTAAAVGLLQHARYDSLSALSVPALAIVFERIEGAAPNTVQRIRVAQMRSFGNAAVEIRALDAFAQPPSDSPLMSFARAYTHSLPTTVLPNAFALETLEAELDRALVHELVVDVDMPHPLPTMRLDLVQIFVAAMRGWNEGYRAFRRGAYPARPAATAVSPVGAVVANCVLAHVVPSDIRSWRLVRWGFWCVAWTASGIAVAARATVAAANRLAKSTADIADGVDAAAADDTDPMDE